MNDNIYLINQQNPFLVSGYGNISPTVQSSRMFACFYAIFGIPLALIFLSNLGELLHTINCAFAGKLVNWSDEEKRKKVLKFLLLLVTGLTLLIFVPSIVLSFLEGWWYSEAFYYCIITLSTVGFGDFVPCKYLDK